MPATHAKERVRPTGPWPGMSHSIPGGMGCVPPRGRAGGWHGTSRGGHSSHLALLWVSRRGAVEVAQRLHLRAGVHRLCPGRHRRGPLDARRRYEGAAGGLGVAGGAVQTPLPSPARVAAWKSNPRSAKHYGVTTSREMRSLEGVGEEGCAPEREGHAAKRAGMDPTACLPHVSSQL